MADEHDTRLWSVVTFIGVLAGITFGAVLVMLWKDRSFGTKLALPAPTPQPLSGGFGLPLLGSATALSPSGIGYQSVARTVTISDTGPTQILRATGTRGWELQCRTVGPPGSIASFVLGNNPAESIQVPAGAEQRIWIASGEDLYAQGDTVGTSVSVSGGER